VITRPYDLAMAPGFLEQVRQRRLNPTGELLDVRHTGPTGQRLLYPWDQMKLGDFFFVPILGRRVAALQVRFRQVAARRDWELTVIRVNRNGQPHLRVCLTCVEVGALKKKAKHYHGVTGLPVSDGRWAAARALRWRRVVASSQPRLVPATPLPAPPPAAHDDPSPAHDDVIRDGVIRDATLSPDYDRAAVMRERLRALGVAT